MLAGVVAAGMFNDGNVNPGRLKAHTVMLAGVVAAGMFNDGNVNPGTPRPGRRRHCSCHPC
ncbi:PPE family protein [Mycobacterium tuberculosis]|nr:PPE family protein [Mycobacterium tuberculosis]